MVTLSEKEFDDILQRNKSVSSGAIMRAVQDASEGFLISDTHTHFLSYMYMYVPLLLTLCWFS